MANRNVKKETKIYRLLEELYCSKQMLGVLQSMIDRKEFVYPVPVTELKYQKVKTQLKIYKLENQLEILNGSKTTLVP